MPVAVHRSSIAPSMGLLWGGFCLLAALLVVGVPLPDGAAAQDPFRPLSLPNRRVGILFPSGTGLSRVMGSEAADPEMVQATLDAIAQTLGGLGYEVVPPDEIVMQLMQADIDCDRGIQYCEAEKALQRLELGAVVLAGIWTEAEPDDLYVRVTVAGAYGEARAKIDAPIAKVAPVALIEAMRDVEHGRAVLTRFDVLPRGARVTLDGKRLGPAPATAEILPGAHEVLVEQLGYVTTARHFELPRGAMAPHVIRVQLQTAEDARAGGARVRPRDASPTAVWDYVAGGALALGGVALMAAPVASLVSGGDCRVDVDGGCEPVDFGVRSGVQLVGGALAAAGGVYFFVATPLRVAMTADRGEFHVQVSGKF